MILEIGTFDNEDFNDFSTWFMGLDLTQFTPLVVEKGPEKPDNFLTENWRRPKILKGIPLIGGDYPHEYVDKIYTFIRSKYEYLNKEDIHVECPLSVFYPAGGCIGWHTNTTHLGYNILLTYSQTGDGFFEYVDLEGDVKRIDDSVGWSYKITKWGIDSEKVWHRACTNCNRITLTYFCTRKYPIEIIKNNL